MSAKIDATEEKILDRVDMWAGLVKTAIRMRKRDGDPDGELTRTIQKLSRLMYNDASGL